MTEQLPQAHADSQINDTPLVPADIPLIERALDELRPILLADGGNVEFDHIEEQTVRVRLRGRCNGCMQAGATLGGVRRHLMHALGKALRVLPVETR